MSRSRVRAASSAAAMASPEVEASRQVRRRSRVGAGDRRRVAGRSSVAELHGVTIAVSADGAAAMFDRPVVLVPGDPLDPERRLAPTLAQEPRLARREQDRLERLARPGRPAAVDRR